MMDLMHFFGISWWQVSAVALLIGVGQYLELRERAQRKAGR